MQAYNNTSPFLVDVNATTSSLEEQQPSCSAEFRFWFATVVIGFLCLLGLVGNTLSILVLQKDNHNRVACFLLQALACADSGVLLINLVVMSLIFGLLPYLGDKNVWLNQQTLGMLEAYIVKYVNPIAYMAQCCTIWTTVLLAINRYVAICRPFRVQKWCTLTRARLQVVCVIVASCLFNLPRFFIVKVVEEPSEDGSLKYKIELTALGANGVFQAVYIVLSTLLIQVLPLVLLTTLNCKLIAEIRAINRRATRSHTSAQVHEDNITLVMIIIILILLVCHTPDGVLQIVSQFNRIQCGTAIYYAFLACNLLIAVNSSTNFILYYFMRRGFRKVLLKKLCGCVKGTYNSTTSVFNNISYSGAKLKMTSRKSCPEFTFDNNSTAKSIEELRKPSL